MTREDVLRKALDRFARDAYLTRSDTARIARDALAEADALPSEAERWQRVDDLVEHAFATGTSPWGALFNVRKIASAHSGPTT
jgi:hypothetical protein